MGLSIHICQRHIYQTEIYIQVSQLELGDSHPFNEAHVTDKISGHTFRPDLERPGRDQGEIDRILTKMKEHLEKYPTDPSDARPLMFETSVKF